MAEPLQVKASPVGKPEVIRAAAETIVSIGEISFRLIFGVCEARKTNGMALALLASGVLLLRGHQDIGLLAQMGAAFGFFMAIAFGISALVTAIRGNLRYGAAICAVVLCSETLLILRWLLRRTSA